jgi:hypothetical protein
VAHRFRAHGSRRPGVKAFEAVHDRHAEHTYIEIERHWHVIGDQREVMDSP